jgi:cytochrome c-type biogenesis protein CcmF
MTSILSRESLFLFNNLLFMAILVVCFTGVIFPLISELLTGQKVTVGPPFYESATGPIFMALLLLMGIAPLSAWGASTFKTLGRAVWKPAIVSLAVLALVIGLGVRSLGALIGFWLVAFTASITLYDYGRAVLARARRTGENLAVSFWRLAGRNRRRYGGYTIHLGIVLMAIGIIGIKSFQVETQGTVKQGQALHLDGYTITYKRLDIWDTNDDRNVARAVVDVSRNGTFLTELHPRRDYYYASQQNMTIPGVRSTLEDDVYVLLVDWQPISSDGATLKVFHNPLINWLWLGAFVLIFGTMIAAWPDRDVEPQRARVVSRETAVGPA